MKTSIPTILILLILLSSLCIIRAEDSLASPAPTASFINEGASINVPAGTSQFDLTFEPGAPGVTNVYAVLGYFGTDQPGFADVGYYPDTKGNPCGPQAAPCIVAGSLGNHYTGFIIWKLIFSDPLPAGAKANFDVVFIGRPSSQGENFFVGVSDLAEANEKLTGPRDLPAEMRSIDEGTDEYGTYNEMIEVPLPEGAKEVFLILADNGTSARAGLRQITISVP